MLSLASPEFDQDAYSSLVKASSDRISVSTPTYLVSSRRRCDHAACNTRGDQRVRAGSSPAVIAARFERQIRGCPTRIPASLMSRFERCNFRMIERIVLIRSCAQHLASKDKDAAHLRTRRHQPRRRPQQATTLVACTLRRSRSEHTPNGISLRPVPYLMLVGLRYCAPKTAKICAKLHSFGCPTSAESFDRREGLLCR
jgi:hypothetical protein